MAPHHVYMCVLKTIQRSCIFIYSKLHKKIIDIRNKDVFLSNGEACRPILCLFNCTLRSYEPMGKAAQLHSLLINLKERPTRYGCDICLFNAMII